MRAGASAVPLSPDGLKSILRLESNQSYHRLGGIYTRDFGELGGRRSPATIRSQLTWRGISSMLSPYVSKPFENAS
jgi:hypothetical protein